MTVEVCVTSVESALIAQQAGVSRVELCAELPMGGITPSYGLIKRVKELLEIPVHVLVRPRSGDFTYTDHEFNTMLGDIDICRSLGVEGIVCGVLDAQFTPDWKRTEQLLERSKDCSFTFHRAFDWVTHPIPNFRKLQEMGVNTLLTSGAVVTAVEGLELLRELNALSVGCEVMPGGGINAQNAGIFKEEGFRAIHLSGSRTVKNISEAPPLPMRAGHLPAENELLRTDGELLAKVIESVN